MLLRGVPPQRQTVRSSVPPLGPSDHAPGPTTFPPDGPPSTPNVSRGGGAPSTEGMLLEPAAQTGAEAVGWIRGFPGRPGVSCSWRSYPLGVGVRALGGVLLPATDSHMGRSPARRPLDWSASFPASSRLESYHRGRSNVKLSSTQRRPDLGIFSQPPLGHTNKISRFSGVTEGSGSLGRAWHPYCSPPWHLVCDARMGEGVNAETV